MILYTMMTVQPCNTTCPLLLAVGFLRFFEGEGKNDITC